MEEICCFDAIRRSVSYASAIVAQSDQQTRFHFKSHQSGADSEPSWIILRPEDNFIEATEIPAWRFLRSAQETKRPTRRFHYRLHSEADVQGRSSLQVRETNLDVLFV